MPRLGGVPEKEKHTSLVGVLLFYCPDSALYVLDLWIPTVPNLQ